jgi:DNA replication and repair protein RecF
MRAGRTLIGPHRVDLRGTYAAKGMAAGLCSTGEQKALLISLILANSRALAEDHGAPPVVLLDEVAAHLDAGRRAALYDEIAALGAQAWMTGTGPELVRRTGGPRAAFRGVGGAGGGRGSRPDSDVWIAYGSSYGFRMAAAPLRPPFDGARGGWITRWTAGTGPRSGALPGR